MVAGGNIRRAEDVKKLLYAGVKRAMLNFSKKVSIDLIKEVSLRFGKEKIAVSLNDFDTLFKQQHLIEQYSSEIVFMHRLDLNSVVNVTEIPCVVVTDTMDESEILRILKMQRCQRAYPECLSAVSIWILTTLKKCVCEPELK